MLAMHGYEFAPVFADATRFTVDGELSRVASLETILGAKQAAGREKDLRFLEAFHARRAEFLAKPRAKVKRPATRGKRPK